MLFRSAEGLIKFITGIDIGEKVEDSLLAGMGILLKDGRIQADRMELRHSLTVLSLIINELQGMSSDFIFAEVGLVTKVDDLGENTFRLWIDKKTDSDFLKFNDGDILKQIVNNMMLGGSDYYTSWMRILSSNLNDNTITVVLFPDSEVPGKVNFAPAADYTVAHRGTVNVPLDDSHNTRELLQL